MDPRLQRLSYSSLLTLHECPRKFQLDKLQAPRQAEDYSASVTFAFGHMVGEGIQRLLAGEDRDKVLFDLFLKWEPDYLAINEKQLKSFTYGVIALDNFISIRNQGYLDEYEVLEYQGRPAAELSFRITLPNGFTYRGYVDLVLRHKSSSEIRVLELKTTSAYSVLPSQYKNSSQAIGYSVILDKIAPDISAYEVNYLVYKTKSKEFEEFIFKKTYMQRALWIRELLLDIDTINMYEGVSIYPMRGESCLAFSRECRYFGSCQMSTEYLTDSLEEGMLDAEAEYQVEVTLQDLIDAQLSKIDINEGDI